MVRRYSLDSEFPRQPPRIQRRKVRGWSIWLAALALILAAASVNAWWRSPERKLQAFVAATRRNDTAEMMKLIDREEVRRLGLTGAKLQALLQAASGASSMPYFADAVPEPFSVAQSRYNRMVRVTLYGRDGKPLRTAKGERLQTPLQAYRAGGEWNIAISDCIFLVHGERLGRENRRQRYAALCGQYGVPSEIYQPNGGRWEHIGGPPSGGP